MSSIDLFFKIIGILSTPPNYVSTTKNTLEREYGTRALQHANITVDIKYLTNPRYDMIFIKISGIPNPDKSLKLLFLNYRCVWITLLEVNRDNQYTYIHQ